MNEIVNDIFVKDKGLKTVIHYQQGTNALPLVFYYRDFDIPDGAESRIYARKPSGAEIYNTGTVSENTVTIPVTTQMTAEYGTVPAQLQIIKDTQILNSYLIFLEIDRSIISDSAIESKDELTVLDELINEARNTISAVQQATENATTQAAYAEEQGDYAKAQGDAAKTQAASAKTQASAAQTAAEKANTAATSANSAATSANNAANRANTAADRCEGLDVTILDNKISQLSATLLDENGTLDLDVMPVGTMWPWWSDTLPSDKWVFGNTDIPVGCTKARQIWGTKTPDTAGRVIVDKSSDTEFNTLGKTGGSKEQSLRALIGAVDGDAGVIAYSATPPVPNQNNYSRGIKGEIYGGSSEINHTTAVVRDDGETPNTLQPYIVSRYIFKIK